MEEINYEELDKKANPGAFSTYDAEVLVPEVQKLEAGDIYLEVGVDKGKSLSIASMVAKPGVRLFGVDINSLPYLGEFLLEYKNTSFCRSDSSEYAAQWKFGKISVLFIDGDHSYEGCKKDIEAWYPHMKEGGVMMFHDCDETSPGVEWAVAEFVSKHMVSEYKRFKRTDKNTSMAMIRL